MRIEHGPGIVPFQTADKITAEMRFGGGKLFSIEFRVGNAVVPRQPLGEGIIRIPPCGSPVSLHPAVFHDQIASLRFIDQNAVFGNRMLD